MRTWEMIKMLTESSKEFGEVFYKTDSDKEQFLICFLRPFAGSIEFRCIDITNDGDFKMSGNPIFYTYENWIEINKTEADKYLKGNYSLL